LLTATRLALVRPELGAIASFLRLALGLELVGRAQAGVDAPAVRNRRRSRRAAGAVSRNERHDLGVDGDRLAVDLDDLHGAQAMPARRRVAPPEGLAHGSA
jgi:hypothetical protein